MLTIDKNGSLYLVYCRPYCFLDAEWIRIILDFSFPQILAMVENDKYNLTHFRLDLQRAPFPLPRFSNGIYRFLILQKEGHVFNWYAMACPRSTCLPCIMCDHKHTRKSSWSKNQDPHIWVGWLEILLY